MYVLYCMYVFAGIQGDSKVGTVIKKYIFWERKMLRCSETCSNHCGTSVNTVCMCDSIGINFHSEKFFSYYGI
jgi:hypothetical protein